MTSVIKHSNSSPWCHSVLDNQYKVLVSHPSFLPKTLHPVERKMNKLFQLPENHKYIFHGLTHRSQNWRDSTLRWKSACKKINSAVVYAMGRKGISLGLTENTFQVVVSFRYPCEVNRRLLWQQTSKNETDSRALWFRRRYKGLEGWSGRIILNLIFHLFWEPMKVIPQCLFVPPARGCQGMNEI